MSTAVAAYPRRACPPLCRIQQRLDSSHIPQVRDHVRRLLAGGGGLPGIAAGSRVAITAGSRGIGGFLEILAGIADAVRACGAEPVVIPAMGSHGGATAEGQHEILRRLGVLEERIGARVESTMETIALGTAPNGAEAHLDGVAARADGIIVMGRVKTHPESDTGLASGLLKMTTVGLGKQVGAWHAHRHGLWSSVREVPKLVLERARVLGGLAVVENAFRRPVQIELVPPRYDAFLETDQRLLDTARQHLARIPFEQLDLLIIEQLGKNISGAGMDPNVIGKWRVSAGARKSPNYHRIVALSLTPESLGNGIGAGMADIVTERFVRACDDHVTAMNVLTASEPDNTLREAAIPLVMPSDRDAIEVGLGAAMPRNEPRVCRIRNTEHLDELWVSPALLDEVRSHPALAIAGEPAELQYEDGNLLEPAG